MKKKYGCFAIHKFMIGLGLSASELLVYALLYSYTVGEIGVFFASHNYISEQTGVSRRTVYSAVKELISKGLIERCEYAGRSGLRAVLSAVNGSEGEKPQSGASENEDEHTGCEAKPEEKRALRVVPGRFLFPDVNTGKVYDEEPKYRILEIGQHKAVKMTLEQYDELKSLIPDIELKNYVDRLASIHIERSANGECWRKGDYRIIREWIKQDFEV